VHADICGGSLEGEPPGEGASNDSGVIENIDFQGFGCTLANEAKVVM